MSTSRFYGCHRLLATDSSVQVRWNVHPRRPAVVLCTTCAETTKVRRNLYAVERGTLTQAVPCGTLYPREETP